MSKSLISVPVENIHPSEDNVRTNIDPKELHGLAQSIAAVGILEPPLVRSNGEDGHYVVVAGHRRLAAVHLANETLGASITSIEVLYDSDELTEQDRVIAMLVENLQREDINPVDEAMGYLRLTSQHGWKQTDIASTVGRNKSHISRRLKLLELPEVVQADLIEGRVTIEDALALANMPTDMILTVREDGYDPYDIERLVRDVERKRGLERRAKELAAKYPTHTVVASSQDIEVADDQRAHYDGWVDLTENEPPEGVVLVPNGTGGAALYRIVDVEPEPEPTVDDNGNVVAPKVEVKADPQRVSAALGRERTAFENAILADIAMRPKVAWFKDIAIAAGITKACNAMHAGRVCKILELNPEKRTESTYSSKEKAQVEREVNDYPTTVRRYAETADKAAMQVAIIGWRLGGSWEAGTAIEAQDKELNFEVFPEAKERKRIERELIAKEKARIAKEQG